MRNGLPIASAYSYSVIRFIHLSVEVTELQEPHALQKFRVKMRLRGGLTSGFLQIVRSRDGGISGGRQIGVT